MKLSQNLSTFTLSLVLLLFHGFSCAIASHENAIIPVRGLVAFYPFSGNADDASGNGNHATVYRAILAPDKSGASASAYEFNGNGEHIVAPVCISPSVLPQVTLVVWAKPEQKDDLSSILSQAAGLQRNRALLMRPSPGRGGCWATSTNGYGSWVWQEVETGMWTFLALSYDQIAGKLVFHVNGTKFERDCTQDDGASFVHIGSNSMGRQNFKGSLDEIRIYNRVLGDHEVGELYKQFQAGINTDTDENSRSKSDRRGLMWAIILGFSLFTGLILAGNIMIRKETPY
jgi:hypothetical protein